MAIVFDLALVSGVAAFHESLVTQHCQVSLEFTMHVLLLLGQLGLPALGVLLHAAAASATAHPLGQPDLDEASSQCAECGQWLGLPLFSC